MKVTTLQVDCDADGDTTIRLWLDCHNTADVDDAIAWLRLTRHFAEHWRKQRGKPAVVTKLEAKG